MHDIIALRQFYSSPLGREVKRWLRRTAARHVARTHGETLVGLGYAAPLLRAIQSSEHVPKTIAALMPATQGAIYWPVEGNNCVALGELERLPFSDNSVHWLLMLHALEFSDHPADILREAHRVLVPGGKLLMFVPHRHRPWRWWGDSPFKKGTSYRYGELRRLVHHAELTITDCSGALMLPPFHIPFWAHIIRYAEQSLAALLPRAGSVICMEVEKQIYAAMKQKKQASGIRIGVRPIAAANAVSRTAPDAPLK
jgi:SAM-dependent methyltransferase